MEFSEGALSKGESCNSLVRSSITTNTSASLVDVLDAINAEYDGSITDIPTNSTNPSSTHDRLTLDSFLDIINDIIGSANDDTLINTIETNLHAAVYGTEVPPETSPTTGDVVDTDVSPDPGTISEVEDLFDRQTDITLESETKDSDGEVSSVTDVQDMFGATTQSSSTEQSSSDEDSNSNDITDTDDMFG
ncbi:hypothetical protein [Halonotius sp. GCM10025705]|uniref:hypothetical protein n=1 Tax=Halonotius sp. GCM10025705 TaxID=3252678 RepID=UPI003608200C